MTTTEPEHLTELKADITARADAAKATAAAKTSGTVRDAAVASQAVAKIDPRSRIKAEIERYKPEVATALPQGYTGGADRFARTVLTAIATDKTGNLVKCSPKSIMGAALQAAQLGLSVGVMGEAWLVPYGNEATFQLGYKGLIALAARSGITITAHTVHERDEFTYELGLDPKLIHRPARGDRGPSEMWYAVARERATGALLNFAVIDRQHVQKRRNANRGKSPAWDQWGDEMALTKAVRQVCKFLPLSVEMSVAMASDGVVREDLTGQADEYVSPYDDDEAIDAEIVG